MLQVVSLESILNINRYRESGIFFDDLVRKALKFDTYVYKINVMHMLLNLETIDTLFVILNSILILGCT
jgi:hypothetical protein